MNEYYISLALDIFKNYALMALIAAIITGYIVSGLTGKKGIGIIAGVIVALIICIIPYISGPECEDCGADMKYGQNYCTVCGHYQHTGDIFGKIECEACGRRIDKNSTVCGYCGVPVN